MNQLPERVGLCECGNPVKYTPIIWAGKELRCICNECDAKIQSARREEDEDSRQAYRRLKWMDICPPLFMETDPARLPKAQFEKVMEWAYGPSGLILHGPTGTCKTRIVWELLKRIYFERFKGITPTVMSAAQFSRKSSDAALHGTSEEWSDDLKTCRLLVIDDLGQAKLTERNETDMFDIVDGRSNRKLPMILTTNFVGNSFSEKISHDLGMSLVRRICEFCEPIAF